MLGRRFTHREDAERFAESERGVLKHPHVSVLYDQRHNEYFLSYGVADDIASGRDAICGYACDHPRCNTIRNKAVTS